MRHSMRACVSGGARAWLVEGLYEVSDAWAAVPLSGNLQADNSSYMLERAVKDLRRALKVQPDHVEVKRFYRTCADELKKQNQ